MDKWGYSYLIELKTFWEKEKLIITSNFSSSHNGFNSCLLLMRQNEYLWSKGLSLRCTHMYFWNFSNGSIDLCKYNISKKMLFYIWNTIIGDRKFAICLAKRLPYKPLLDLYKFFDKLYKGIPHKGR